MIISSGRSWVFSFGWCPGILLICLFSTILEAREVVAEEATRLHRFRVESVVTGVPHPWSLAFLPEGGFLLTERSGKLHWFREGELLEVAGLPEIHRRGQGGLLEVALHPDFANNRWVYLAYADQVPGGLGTVVGRGRWENGRLSDFEEIFRMNRGSRSGAHFGCRIIFDRDGYLYFTIGDRGNRNWSQALDNHAGSVIRLHDDGRVPEDNPFVGREGALPEIWSYGHRNPQGLVYDRQNHRIWLHEHGPQGGDEVNLIERGGNYGWPLVTLGEEYGGGRIGVSQMEGMIDPVVNWTPSIAPSGMLFYEGDLFPRWRGHLLVGALRQQHVRRLGLSGTQVIEQEMMLHRTLGRIRDLRQGPEGAIYIVTDMPNGGVYRMVPR